MACLWRAWKPITKFIASQSTRTTKTNAYTSGRVPCRRLVNAVTLQRPVLEDELLFSLSESLSQAGDMSQIDRDLPLVNEEPITQSHVPLTYAGPGTIWLGASWPAYEPTNLRASNPQSRSANGPELRPGVHRDAQGEDCVSVPGALEKVHNYWSLQVLGKREDSECRGELLPFPVLSQPGKAWRHHANGGWPAAVFHETETGGGKSSWPLEDHYEPGSHATNPQTQSSSDDLLARALPSPHQWVSGSIRESNPWPFHARLLPASGDEHVTHWT